LSEKKQSLNKQKIISPVIVKTECFKWLLEISRKKERKKKNGRRRVRNEQDIKLLIG
jgi:hypothetical protein